MPACGYAIEHNIGKDSSTARALRFEVVERVVSSWLGRVVYRRTFRDALATATAYAEQLNSNGWTVPAAIFIVAFLAAAIIPEDVPAARVDADLQALCRAFAPAPEASGGARPEGDMVDWRELMCVLATRTVPLSAPISSLTRAWWRVYDGAALGGLPSGDVRRLLCVYLDGQPAREQLAAADAAMPILLAESARFRAAAGPSVVDDTAAAAQAYRRARRGTGSAFVAAGREPPAPFPGLLLAPAWSPFDAALAAEAAVAPLVLLPVLESWLCGDSSDSGGGASQARLRSGWSSHAPAFVRAAAAMARAVEAAIAACDAADTASSATARLHWRVRSQHAALVAWRSWLARRRLRAAATTALLATRGLRSLRKHAALAAASSRVAATAARAARRTHLRRGLRGLREVVASSAAASRAAAKRATVYASATCLARAWETWVAATRQARASAYCRRTLLRKVWVVWTHMGSDVCDVAERGTDTDSAAAASATDAAGAASVNTATAAFEATRKKSFEQAAAGAARLAADAAAAADAAQWELERNRAMRARNNARRRAASAAEAAAWRRARKVAADAAWEAATAAAAHEAAEDAREAAAACDVSGVLLAKHLTAVLSAQTLPDWRRDDALLQPYADPNDGCIYMRRPARATAPRGGTVVSAGVLYASGGSGYGSGSGGGGNGGSQSRPSAIVCGPPMRRALPALSINVDAMTDKEAAIIADDWRGSEAAAAARRAANRAAAAARVQRDAGIAATAIARTWRARTARRDALVGAVRKLVDLRSDPWTGDLYLQRGAGAAARALPFPLTTAAGRLLLHALPDWQLRLVPAAAAAGGAAGLAVAVVYVRVLPPASLAVAREFRFYPAVQPPGATRRTNLLRGREAHRAARSPEHATATRPPDGYALCSVCSRDFATRRCDGNRGLACAECCERQHALPLHWVPVPVKFLGAELGVYEEEACLLRGERPRRIVELGRGEGDGAQGERHDHQARSRESSDGSDDSDGGDVSVADEFGLLAGGV